MKFPLHELPQTPGFEAKLEQLVDIWGGGEVGRRRLWNEIGNASFRNMFEACQKLGNFEALEDYIDLQLELARKEDANRHQVFAAGEHFAKKLVQAASRPDEDLDALPDRNFFGLPETKASDDLAHRLYLHLDRINPDDHEQALEKACKSRGFLAALESARLGDTQLLEELLQRHEDHPEYVALTEERAEIASHVDRITLTPLQQEAFSKARASLQLGLRLFLEGTPCADQPLEDFQGYVEDAGRRIEDFLPCEQFFSVLLESRFAALREEIRVFHSLTSKNEAPQRKNELRALRLNRMKCYFLLIEQFIQTLPYYFDENVYHKSMVDLYRTIEETDHLCGDMSQQLPNYAKNHEAFQALAGKY